MTDGCQMPAVPLAPFAPPCRWLLSQAIISSPDGFGRLSKCGKMICDH